MTELGTEEIVMALDANRGVESIYQPVCGSDGDELLLIDRLEIRAMSMRSRRRRLFKQNGVRQLMDTLDEDRTADHQAAVF